VSLAPRIAAGCLAVAMAAGLTGCRQRVADHRAPTVGATSQNTDNTSDSAAPPTATDAPAASGGTASGAGSVSQRDVDNLQGILTSVNGAVTSARSAIAGDTASPRG
jgi:hypothetical protein